MAGRRARSGSRKGSTPLIRVLIGLVILALALLLAVILVGLLHRRPVQPASEPPEEKDTVTVGGQEVEIDEDLPQSQLEAEHFTKAEDGTITYSGSARYGIDVSSHQGEIDWAAVAGDGVEFAILRIGYRGYSAGALNPDERFEENFQGARENGIDVGVYFFSQAISEEEAREEAGQVLTWLKDRSLEGPVVFDWEHITDDTARTDDLDGATVTACARAFCETVQQGGYTPMVYCNGMLGYLSYDLKELEGYELWYAEYQDHPSYAYEVAIWQYTNTGSVAGVQGNVDRNIWFRDQ